MRSIRWAVLLGIFAIITSAAGQDLPDPYIEVDNWARLPAGRTWGTLYAPAVDSHGNVWVLDRCGEGDCAHTDVPPLQEFDSSGRFLKAIGQGLFAFPHGLKVDKDDNLWVADAGAANGKGNQVTKLSEDGKVLLTLGTKGVMGGGPQNFVGATDVLIAPNGDIFVADGHAVEPSGGGQGYGFNPRTSDASHMRIAKFSPDGKFIKAWGKLGTAPGEFNVPHGLAMDSQGRLFVADRGNSRIQIFDQEGKLLAIWKQFGKPCSVFIDKNDTIYVIDSDSIENLWSWKYSALGYPCLTCLMRVPRLTDVGAESTNFSQGIRIGSAKDGSVQALIPPHMGAFGPTTIPEFLTADAGGDLYVAEGRNWEFRKYVKKVQLPDGGAKATVERACQLCHDFRDFPRVNFDRQRWDLAVRTMVQGGAPLRTEDIPAVVDYLSKNFNQVPVPGISVPGSVQASIQEWDVPTPNSMPYDIFHSHVNGFTWFTELFGNAIVRFDPKTQQFKEYHLSPGTNPDSLLEFRGGNRVGVIEFASEGGGYLGEFHPVDGPYPTWFEGDVIEYPIPGPKLRIHDIAGGVWLTVPQATPPMYSQGSKIGRLNISSTDVRLTDVLTTSASPYDIAVNSKSVPFFTERHTARLGSVDPGTMQVSEYPLPNPESEARGITITPDDLVWYTDYNRGCLGRFNPKTNQFSEWPSPSGPRSHPYGITHIAGVIWYAETGTEPNMLVRFDPKTQQFQSWPVKDGGGIRRIYADSDGSLWFTRPLTNGIAHVAIK